MINRPILMKVHVLIAVFILPIAIMFFVTGAFYTWGIKGDYETTVQKLHLKIPFQEELSYLINVVETELNKQQVSLPTGKAKIKKIGQSFQLEWTGSSKDVVLEPTSDPLIAQLKIKNTGWHRHFVQLHKAKGGIAFKVYATILAVGLLFLLISGFIMAWQLPRLRKMTLISTMLGLIFFVVMFVSS
ncbi:MAG: PepSY domain-containing protein [Methylococcaceae bacterium]|nr:PepSY domain-containing protein [Methylococcaceae bacterium]